MALPTGHVQATMYQSASADIGLPTLQELSLAKESIVRRAARGATIAGNIASGMVILLICAVMIYPFIWMVSASFESVIEMFNIPPAIIPAQPTLDN